MRAVNERENDMTNLNTAIDFIDAASTDDISILINAIKQRQGTLAHRKATQFKRGDKVSFVGRRGGTVSGVVKKINQKTVSVTTDVCEWRVAPTFLKMVG